MIADPATYVAGVPHDEFGRRRRRAPVAWAAEPQLVTHGTGGPQVRQGTGFWAVTRHADVVAVSRQPQVFSSAEQGAFLADPRTPHDLARARQLLVNMDAPEHLRIRRFVSAAFAQGAVRKLARDVTGHAQRLVAQVAGRAEFDAVTDLAAELSLLVLTDLLGVPAEDRHLLFRWSNNLVGFDDPDYGAGRVEVYRQTFHEAFQYAGELARARRRRPGTDLTSLLVSTEVGGERLTEAEFCQLWLLLVIAGNETTRHLLSGGLLALSQWPDQRAALLADPGLTASAVEELLRWVTPIMQFRRTAVVDTQLAGQPITAGDKVVLYYVSANRDEQVFHAPQRLDFARRPNPHLAFGVGPHFCLGFRLAQLEAATLLDTLRPHLHGLRQVAAETRLESSFMNGLKRLPLTLRGAA